jgi:hypothetical protein
MSKEDVAALLGRPNIKLDEHKWRYLDRPGWSMILDIHFDDNAKVVCKEYFD